MNDAKKLANEDYEDSLLQNLQHTKTYNKNTHEDYQLE